MTRRLTALLITLAATALLAAGCGEKEEPGSGERATAPEKLTLMLDYLPNPDHAGIYAAKAAGYYEQAGIDLEIRQPPNAADVPKLVRAGRVDIGISYPPDLLLARDKGADLVSVGALVQKPLTSLMSLSDKVRTAADLKGKRLGTAGIPYQDAYLDTILERAKVDRSSVKVTNLNFDFVRPMLANRVDATLGAFWNIEGVDLAARGKRPRIMRMDQLGVPTYPELIFIVRREMLKPRGASLVRRFIQATARGHRLIQRKPQDGVDALLAAERGLDRSLTERQLRQTLPVFFPADDDRPFGYQEPAQWDAFARWMLANRLLKQEPVGARGMTNEFLPGEGLDPGTAGLQ